MGPTNIALVKLFQADQKLREAQQRLDATTKNVRVQERRVNDLAERLRLAQQKLRENQSASANLDLDLRARDQKIEKLRTQQQTANNNKEYQAFLVEINTEKVDKQKVEEQALKVMEAVEKGQAEVKDLSAQLEAERAKLASMQAEVGGKVAALQAEVARITPERDAAAAAVSPKGRQAFERLADRNDGEALSALAKPDRRREEYVCTACNMDLVTDVYNRLHSREEIVFCPSCGRILYIPADLPVDQAVHKPKERKEPRGQRNVGAAANRQSNAADILRSVTPEEEDEPASGSTEPSPPQAEPTDSVSPEGEPASAGSESSASQQG